MTRNGSDAGSTPAAGSGMSTDSQPDGGDDGILPVNRRDMLILLGASGVASAVGSASAKTSGTHDEITAGTAALAQEYKLAEAERALYVGPDSAKGNVSPNDGDLYFASDTADVYNGDGGSWSSIGTIGSGGSAITAQEDGGDLTTDMALVDWQSGLTAANPSGDEVNVNVDESEVDHDSTQNYVSNEHVDHSTVSISSGTGLTGGGDITANRTLGIATDGVTGTEIDLSDIAGSNITVDATNDELDAASGGVTQKATGTVTASGGSSPALNTTLTNVSTTQTLDYWLAIHVDSDPAFNADYAYNYDYYHQWDDSAGELDIHLTINWDTDPGAGNDVTLRWEVLQ